MHKLKKPVPPPGWEKAVVCFRQENPPSQEVNENKRWARFADSEQELYAELKRLLVKNQSGLCAYCECETTEFNRQIEHVVPKKFTDSDCDLTLDLGNLLLCCLGGTQKTSLDKSVSRKNRRKDHSCGEAKGRSKLPIGPYDLPEFTLFTQCVKQNDRCLGLIVDSEACQRAKLSDNDIQQTIDLLNLNCRRLSLARFEVWEAIENDIIAVCELHQAPEQREKAFIYLVKKHAEKSLPFYTTALLCLKYYFPDLMV